MTSKRKRGAKGFKLIVWFVDSIAFKQYIYCLFLRIERVRYACVLLENALVKYTIH